MVVFIGPTVVRTNDKGDFWGIAGMIDSSRILHKSQHATGHWCWITQPYSSGRIVLEYLWVCMGSFFTT